MISTDLQVATLARCLCGLLAILSSTRLIKNANGQTSAQMPKIDLAGRSFSLLSTVYGYHGPHTHPELLYTLDEMHSAWQRRSRLQLGTVARHLHSFDIYDGAKRQDGSETTTIEDATFYADDKQLLVVVNAKPCLSMGFDLLDHLLSLGFLFGCSLEQTHLIGAARLLQFIDNNRDKFSMVTEDLKRQIQGSYLQFGAEFTINPIDNFRIIVSYSESVALDLPRGIPRSVKILNSRLSFGLSYSFMRYKPLERYRLHHDSSLLRDTTQDYDLDGSIAFDSFAFPRGLGCSRELSLEVSEVLAREARGLPRFSFVAQKDHDRSSSTVVAYEPTLNTLRVDELDRTRSIQITTNYNQDRTYHVLNRLARHDFLLDSVLQVRQNEHIDDNLNCIVLKATSKKPEQSDDDRAPPHTLGQMLLGSQRLAYLGLARVRGVEAQVYEAHDSEWPTWVQQPAVFQVRQAGSNETNKSNLMTRDELESVKKLSAQRTSLFYFRRVAGGSHDDEFLNSQLLRIEIFLKQDKHGAEPLKSAFNIYDFSWHLKAVAPNGARYEDFLSLGDDCLSPPSEDNRFASLELLLEADQPMLAHERDDGWLSDSSKRNLALLRAARDQLGLPGTMIYDLESRYLQTSSETSASQRHLLPLVVRAASRTKALAALIYMGRVSINPQHENRLTSISPLTFQMCHGIAAHQRRDTLFAYKEQGECLLMSNDGDSEVEQLDNDDENGALKTIFALDPAGVLELYQVKHHVKAKLTTDDLFANFEQTRRLLPRSFGLVLTDPTRDDNSDDDKTKQPAVQAGRAVFKIRRLSMNYLDEKQDYELDEQHLSSTNKFEGFGLVPSDRQNRLTLPKRLEVGSTSENQESEMTFEQCQAVCLLDLECRSYSTCIVAGQIECILSNVSFASPTIVLQLMVLRDQKAKFGETFSLSLEPDELELPTEAIKVKRHPTCELHNKRYLDLFSKTANQVFNLARGQTYHFEAVTSLEQCAELCFRSTLNYMRYENEKPSTSLNQHLQEDKRKQEGQSEQEKTCDSFIYLDYFDAQRAGVLEDIAKLTVSGGFFDGNPSGLCRIDKPTSKSVMLPITDDVKRSKDSSQERRLEAINYIFDYSTLYERRAGVSLIESPKTSKERSAFFSLDMEQDEIRLVLEAFVERGDNSGRTRAIGRLEDCARHCFEQFTLLWPGCRSFDYIEVVGADKHLVQEYCAFNTATLRQTQLLERCDLVRWSPDKQERVALRAGETVRVHHYDPKEGLAASSSDERYRGASVTPRQAPRRRSDISFRSFWLFVYTLSALAIGLILGSYLGSVYLKSLFKDEDDRQGLVEEGGLLRSGNVMPVPELLELGHQLQGPPVGDK